MTHIENHRGAGPEDRQLFTEQTRETLLRATDEAIYLLDRGYNLDSVLNVVGRHHELRVRQRIALQRCICTTEQAYARRKRMVPISELNKLNLEIDGFNLIISIEVALSHGLLLHGFDGAYRDLAGLRGSYRIVNETDCALKLLGKVFNDLGIASARFYLDQPVSNSGRLRQCILEHAASWSAATEVFIVRNPDVILFNKENVVSSDALVLDHASSWVNILKYIINNELRDIWVLDLQNSI